MTKVVPNPPEPRSMQHDVVVWVGIDWATEEHQVCGVDGQSKTLFEGKVKHTGDAIEAFVERLLESAMMRCLPTRPDVRYLLNSRGLVADRPPFRRS